MIQNIEITLSPSSALLSNLTALVRVPYTLVHVDRITKCLQIFFVILGMRVCLYTIIHHLDRFVTRKHTPLVNILYGFLFVTGR